MLRKFSDYPFSSDEVFQVRAISLFLDAELDARSGSLETILQQGLIRILEHASAQSVSEQEILDLKLKTQLFYFNRCVLITVNLI